MKHFGTIYPCTEYETVSLPISEILVDGKVEVFPEVTGKGYFDIDFRNRQLELTANRFIGIVPLNRRVSIHVQPRFPIKNVLHLVDRARSHVKFLSGHIRGYRIDSAVYGEPERLFANSLIDCLTKIQVDGPLRRYTSRIIRGGYRGRMLFGATVSEFIAKGLRNHQVRELTELAVNLPENQLANRILSHVAKYFSQLADKESKARSLAAGRLRQIFDQVTDARESTLDLARTIPNLIASLPSHRRSFEQVLWLCYLIATRQGIAIESFGSTRIESMLLNMADIFEDYCRRIVSDRADEIIAGCIARNGNVTQIPLFRDNKLYATQPDIYLQSQNSVHVIIDAKYKPKLKASDRYEVLAFCEAANAKIAIFLKPTSKLEGDSSYLGTTQGGIAMYEVTVSLATEDLDREELRIIETLRRIVNRTD